MPRVRGAAPAALRVQLRWTAVLARLLLLLSSMRWNDTLFCATKAPVQLRWCCASQCAALRACKRRGAAATVRPLPPPLNSASRSLTCVSLPRHSSAINQAELEQAQSKTLLPLLPSACRRSRRRRRRRPGSSSRTSACGRAAHALTPAQFFLPRRIDKPPSSRAVPLRACTAPVLRPSCSSVTSPGTPLTVRCAAARRLLPHCSRSWLRAQSRRDPNPAVSSRTPQRALQTRCASTSTSTARSRTRW